MNRILSDYFEICSKFRANGLSKSERQQRHALLSKWEKTDFESGRLSLGEFFGITIMTFAGTECL